MLCVIPEITCLMGQFRRSLIHFTLSAHRQVTQHIEDMNHELSSYLLNGSNKETIHGPASSAATANGVYHMAMSILSTSMQKGFLFWQLYFFTRIATVEIVVWYDTKIVPHDSQKWVIQCTWSSHRNNLLQGLISLMSDVLYAAKGSFTRIPVM